MGATLGVTIMGAIVNHGLPPGVRRRARGSAIHRLPPAARAGLANALHPAFLAAAFVSLVVWVIAVVCVKEQPLRRTLDDDLTPPRPLRPTPATTAVESRP